MDILDEKFAITAFIVGLGVQSKELMFSISKNPEASMAEVLAKTEKYINGEEALLYKQRALPLKRKRAGVTRNRNEALGGRQTGTDPQGGTEKTESDPQEEEGTSGIAWDHLSLSCSSGIHLGNTPPLTASVSQVLREVQHEKFMRWPSQIKLDPTKRDNTKYCEFHRDHAHRTDDCIQLRKKTEYLIRREHLRHYVASEGQEQVQQPPPRQPTPARHQPPLGEIYVISRGFTGGRESSSARKAHLRSIKSGETLEVQSVSKLPRLDTTITFSDSDMEGCQHPHDDPLMIKVVVANKTIHRVLIDNGSSADIIFVSAFDKMVIRRKKLEPVNACLRGFSGERVLPLGSIQLVLTLGDPPCQATTTVRFLIVDAPSAYNMLLGRPFLNVIRAIPSAYHMVIKFPTTNGVGMVRGNQFIARECYLASMKQNTVDNIYMDELDIRDGVST